MMKTMTRQFGSGWRGARWQWLFIAAFVPASFLICALTGYKGMVSPDSLTLSLLLLAALGSLLWAGAKEGPRSPLAVPTLVILSIFAFAVLLCKIAFFPKPVLSVTFAFGSARLRVEAVRRVPEGVEPPGKANPLAAYDFIRFA